MAGLTAPDPARPVPAWPAVTVVLDAAGAAVVEVAGTLSRVAGDGLAAGRVAALAEVRRRTAALARPVRVTAVDPTGRWALLVHPDGRVTPAAPTRRR